MKYADINQCTIAIIGLGYVGLPLAVEFGKKIRTIGFDIDSNRVNELNSHYDHTLEVESEDLKQATHLLFTNNLSDLSDANVFIITVPTPINPSKDPDLSYLIAASKSIGKLIKKGDIVIYESTVYPGATEDDCIPIIEQESGLIFNKDFFAGYSPERINPGDKKNRLSNIKKVTSGSTEEVAEFVDSLYQSIITAGTHKAPSIRVAEAAKVIENTQRDLNIALINEFAIIFNRLGIDTHSVLEAAGTKWNFLPFRPGLVGGHCISVDPYYLTHKAEAIGYHPDVILAGRRINDGMGNYVVSQLIKTMIAKNIRIKHSKILILGFSFKENCPDIRNTRVIDIIRELDSYNVIVEVYDPWVSTEEASKEYGVHIIKELNKETYDSIIIAVAHGQFLEMGVTRIHELGKNIHVLYDIKSLFSKETSDIRL